MSGSILFGRSPFYLTPFPSPNGEGCPKDGVRYKGAGFPLQSSLPKTGGREGFTLQSLTRHQTLMKKFSAFIGLQTENNNRTQVYRLILWFGKPGNNKKKCKEPFYRKGVLHNRLYSTAKNKSEVKALW